MLKITKLLYHFSIEKTNVELMSKCQLFLQLHKKQLASLTKLFCNWDKTINNYNY